MAESKTSNALAKSEATHLSPVRPVTPTEDSLRVPENTQEFKKLEKLTNQNYVNINIVLNQVAAQTVDTKTLAATARELDAINAAIEARHLQNYKNQLQILEDHRERDPDEIDKRKSNDARRWLKKVLGLTASGCILACIMTVISMIALHSSTLIVVAAILGSGGIALLLALVPLASGESMSSGDMERLFTTGAKAIGHIFSHLNGVDQPPQNSLPDRSESGRPPQTNKRSK